LIKGVELRAAARRELVEAFSWYEERDPMVAARFLDELERACQQIVEAPGTGNLWPGLPVRKVVLRRYPYAVIYLPKQPIEIIAIAHGRRDAGYWQDRL
jgi:plasmid stabilization system protein ParE